MRVEEYGDAGVLVRLAGDDAEANWRTAQRIARGLLAEPPAGFVDVIATFRDVFVTFDPLVTTHAAIGAAARRAADGVLPDLEPATFTVPVVYGGEDLPEVASELGLRTHELVAWHTAQEWTIRVCASPAGAPMLDGPTPPAPIRRRAQPRVRVPGGSVALSGQQCMIYPVDSPGGWRLIGRTPVRCSDPHREPFTTYRAGDRMRFVAISPEEAERWPPVLA